MQVPLTKIDDYTWEVPKSFRKDMRVPARLFASEKLLGDIGNDRSIEQLANTATLPGVERAALAMPDIHEGYGFPIGGVVATRTEDGLISPGGIGYDVNCGVRLLRSDARDDDVKAKLETLATQIQRDVPSGLGRGGGLVLGPDRMDQVLRSGVEWMADQGYAEADDLIFCEASGKLPEADPSTVSEHAKRRGRDQLGTLGSGNHFLEVQRVERIFDETAAKIFGLFERQVVLMIHCGSRGVGHQVATDYIRSFLPKLASWGILLPDRELVGAPFRSSQGQQYFRAMNAAANFAFANRQMITNAIRGSWKRVFGDALGGLKLVYDVAHNMGKVERYTRSTANERKAESESTQKNKKNEMMELVVHRKGATRAFGPGRDELPGAYQGVGQPVLIPGSMGTASYVLVGTTRAEEISFSTTCHGAGRRLSRSAAKKQIPYERLRSEMDTRGIVIRAGSRSGLLEEAAQAYKDVDEVVRVVDALGIAKRVARCIPLAVVKG